MDKRTKSVVVVEDDHDTRVALRLALEYEGYFVISAANGLDAIKLLKRMTPPSFLIVDIQMPIMTGDQLLGVLSQDPILSSVPVIQISAAQTAQRPGTCCKFDKPLDLAKLLSALSTQCGY